MAFLRKPKLLLNSSRLQKFTNFLTTHIQLLIKPCCPWIQKKLYSSGAVPPATVGFHLLRVSRNSHLLSVNDKSDNEVKPGAAHRSPSGKP